MFNRTINSFKVFWLKPLKFNRGARIIDWAVIWSMLFVFMGINDPNAVYFYMELRNSLIAGGL